MKDILLFKVKPKPPKKTISIEELNVDLLCEHTVMLESFYSKNQNPKPSRRKDMVKQMNEKTGEELPEMLYQEITEEQVANWFKCRRKIDKG